jgi:thiol-disulfide isomerase/thioredoxin
MKAVLAILLLLVPLAAHAAEPKPFAEGSWQALRQAHHGRPTLVHFWGLTCAPCLIELPQWARFARERRDADIVMVGADPVAERPADLAKALTKAGLDEVESWRFADDFAERLQYEVDPAWHGELPFTVLLARDGTSRTVLGTVDFAELNAWLGRQKPQP